MNATERELTFTKITGFVALLNAILNYFLILHFGAIGAAIATVVSQGVASLLGLRLAIIENKWQLIFTSSSMWKTTFRRL